MSADKVKDAVSRLVRRKGREGAAKALGVSGPYISMLLNGQRTPGPRVLRALGLKKKVVFKRIYGEDPLQLSGPLCFATRKGLYEVKEEIRPRPMR